MPKAISVKPYTTKLADALEQHLSRTNTREYIDGTSLLFDYSSFLAFGKYCEFLIKRIDFIRTRVPMLYRDPADFEEEKYRKQRLFLALAKSTITQLGHERLLTMSVKSKRMYLARKMSEYEESVVDQCRLITAALLLRAPESAISNMPVEDEHLNIYYPDLLHTTVKCAAQDDGKVTTSIRLEGYSLYGELNVSHAIVVPDILHSDYNVEVRHPAFCRAKAVSDGLITQAMWHCVDESFNRLKLTTATVTDHSETESLL